MGRRSLDADPASAIPRVQPSFETEAAGGGASQGSKCSGAGRADEPGQRALGLCARGSILVRGSDELFTEFVVLTALDGNNSLTWSRETDRRIQIFGDAVLQAQAAQARGRQYYGFIPAGLRLLQACIDIAADVDEVEVGPGELELLDPSKAAGSNPATRL